MRTAEQVLEEMKPKILERMEEYKKVNGHYPLNPPYFIDLFSNGYFRIYSEIEKYAVAMWSRHLQSKGIWFNQEYENETIDYLQAYDSNPVIRSAHLLWLICCDRTDLPKIKE